MSIVPAPLDLDSLAVITLPDHELYYSEGYGVFKKLQGNGNWILLISKDKLYNEYLNAESCSPIYTQLPGYEINTFSRSTPLLSAKVIHTIYVMASVLHVSAFVTASSINLIFSALPSTTAVWVAFAPPIFAAMTTLQLYWLGNHSSKKV